MSDKCDCFTETLERVKSHLTEQGKIPAGATDISFGWQGQTYMLSGGQYAPVNPKVEVKFRAVKKGGGHAKNLTKNEISIAASHCCYCGRKYKRDDK